MASPKGAASGKLAGPLIRFASAPMSDIPDDPKRIRERIRRYERGLQKEKQTFGSYNDGAGKRYFIGPLYLLLGDLEGALKAFQWFDKTFPDDTGEAGQKV